MASPLHKKGVHYLEKYKDSSLCAPAVVRGWFMMNVAYCVVLFIMLVFANTVFIVF